MVAHFHHFAAAAANGFHDDADEILRDVDHQTLERLEFLAIFRTHHDFGLANHQFESFATHGFDQDSELQFTTTENAEGFRSVRVFHANGNVGEKFACQTIAQIARSEKIAF